MEVNNGRWRSSRVCFGRMKSVLGGEVAVLICCTAAMRKLADTRSACLRGALLALEAVRTLASSPRCYHRDSGSRLSSLLVASRPDSAGVGGHHMDPVYDLA
jgi:hypothetical protein